MVSTKKAPYINYHEALNNPIKGENYAEVPLFIGKGQGAGSVEKVSEFKTYLEAKTVVGEGTDSLATTVKEFYIENNNNPDNTLRVNKCYAMNLGSTATTANYLTALDNSKYKKDASAIVFTGLDWGKYTAPTEDDDGSYENQETIKNMLLSALDIIHEDKDDEAVNQMESGILRILYVELPAYCDTTTSPTTHTLFTDEALIQLTKYLREEVSGSTANKKLQDSRLVFVENQITLKEDNITEVDKFFGRTIARICNTPYYVEAGYEGYKSIEIGSFRERKPEERDALLNAGVLFNEDDYSLPEITPRICLAVSSAWGVDNVNNVDQRVNDALLHTRRNADHQVRELLKVIAPQLKRNETSVNIAFVRTDCQLYLENQVSLGRLMDFSIKVEEASVNPYQLKVSGSMTPVNCTIGIDFENYIGAPYTVATDYI